VGAVLTRQSYYPYGGVRQAGDLPTDITFTGQRSDATGLMHFGARYFSSTLGRFISADSIVPGLGNPQNLNRFSYVLGNPIRYMDPSGHVCVENNGSANEAVTSGDCESDTVKLTTWGKRMFKLFLKYQITSGWWNNNKPGTLTVEGFLTLMLSYELSPFKDSDAIPNPILRSGAGQDVFEKDMGHGTAHWFYKECSKNSSSGTCTDDTRNAMINFAGISQSARGRYCATIDPTACSDEVRDPSKPLESIADKTPQGRANIALATNIVDAIQNPKPEWRLTAMNTSNIVDASHPFTWGNASMLSRLPTLSEYLWMLPGGDPFYLLTVAGLQIP
jgi:RHS repeat-associated protein